MIDKDEFFLIKEELDINHDAEIGKKAEEYLDKYNLRKSFRISEIIDIFKNGATMDVWQNLYIFERSMPYYEGQNPNWLNRLQYFCATYVVENNYLLGKTIMFRDNQVKFLFKDNIYIDTDGSKKRTKSDHDLLTSGFALGAPDFYFWFNNCDEKCVTVEYKFCSKYQYKTPQEVVERYKDGGHLHRAKVVVFYLEATESFWIVDYLNRTCMPLDLTAPAAEKLVVRPTIDPFLLGI